MSDILKALDELDEYIKSCDRGDEPSGWFVCDRILELSAIVRKLAAVHSEPEKPVDKEAVIAELKEMLY